MIKNNLRKFTIILIITISAIIGLGMRKEQSDMKSSITTQGINHVGLTVKNLELTSKFFIETLNFTKVGEKPDYPAIFVSDGSVMITLWQAKNPESASSFDRKNNIGLHHLALNVNSFEDLEAIYQKIQETPDISIEFSPELLGKGPAKHMMFYEPGGIRIELIFKPSKK